MSERERKEVEDQKKREKHIVSRGIEGKDEEVRNSFIEEVARSVIGKKLSFGRVGERKGEEIDGY